VFCLYAEDADIFGKHLMFHDYMAQFSTKDMRKGLRELFRGGVRIPVMVRLSALHAD
jgi:hypothetical protein